jgi:hypothetical protein
VLFFEIKAPGGRVSSRQQQFAAAVEGMRHLYFVVRSLDEALDQLRTAEVPLRARAWI